MTNNDKKDEKNKKVLLVIKVFLENEKYTMGDISKITNIPLSSVQRYLKYEEVSKVTTKQVADYIRERIKYQRIEASKKGGKNSKKNNLFVKDTNGKFMGSVKI